MLGTSTKSDNKLYNIQTKVTRIVGTPILAHLKRCKNLQETPGEQRRPDFERNSCTILRSLLNTLISQSFKCLIDSKWQRRRDKMDRKTYVAQKMKTFREQMHAILLNLYVL